MSPFLTTVENLAFLLPQNQKLLLIILFPFIFWFIIITNLMFFNFMMLQRLYALFCLIRSISHYQNEKYFSPLNFTRFQYPCYLSLHFLDQLNNDLYRAALIGDTKNLKPVLSFGGNPDISDGQFNRTALHVAALNNNTEFAKLLLERGAEIDVRDESNKTPLHAAAFNNSTEAAKLLLERGAKIEAKDVSNNTPLHHAAFKNSTEAVKLLLERGAEIDARDVSNNTPLHAAAKNNSTEAVKLLLERGTEIDARDVSNNTPFHAAAQNNSTEAAKLLLECGAEIDARNVNYQTPLEVARSILGSNETVICLLMEHVANTC